MKQCVDCTCQLRKKIPLELQLHACLQSQRSSQMSTEDFETHSTTNSKSEVLRTILETLAYFRVSFSEEKRRLTIDHIDNAQCPVARKVAFLFCFVLFFSKRKAVFSYLFWTFKA